MLGCVCLFSKLLRVKTHQYQLQKNYYLRRHCHYSQKHCYHCSLW